MPNQRLLVGKAQPARRCAAGDDQSLRLDGVFADLQGEWPLGQIGRRDVSQLVLSAKALRLLAHIGNQFRTLNSFRETGKIFHQRGQ